MTGQKGSFCSTRRSKLLVLMLTLTGMLPGLRSSGLNFKIMLNVELELEVVCHCPPASAVLPERRTNRVGSSTPSQASVSNGVTRTRSPPACPWPGVTRTHILNTQVRPKLQEHRQSTYYQTPVVAHILNTQVRCEKKRCVWPLAVQVVP